MDSPRDMVLRAILDRIEGLQRENEAYRQDVAKAAWHLEEAMQILKVAGYRQEGPTH